MYVGLLTQVVGIGGNIQINICLIIDSQKLGVNSEKEFSELLHVPIRIHEQLNVDINPNWNVSIYLVSPTKQRLRFWHQLSRNSWYRLYVGERCKPRVHRQ